VAVGARGLQQMRAHSSLGYSIVLDFLFITLFLNHNPWNVSGVDVTRGRAEVTFLPLPQPKTVLDLATLKGCKAELT